MMDLTWSDTDDAFRLEVRTWLTDNLRSWHDRHEGPILSGDTREGFTQHLDWERTLSEAGWSAISWPREFGGRDSTLWEWLIFEEEYYRAGGPPRITQNGIAILAPALLEYGTAQQKQYILPRMTSTADVWCQAGPSPTPDPIWQTSKARRRRSTVDGFSTDRKPGRPAGLSAHTCSACSAATADRIGTKVSHTFSCRSTPPGSAYADSTDSTGTKDSRRCSSTPPFFPTSWHMGPQYSARSMLVGWLRCRQRRRNEASPSARPAGSSQQQTTCSSSGATMTGPSDPRTSLRVSQTRG